MAKNRVTRKKLLKEPDEFLTFSARWINWGKANAKPLIIGGATLFSVVILMTLYNFFQERRNNTAEAMLSDVLTKYQTEIETKTPPEALGAVKGDFETLMASYGRLPAGRLGALIYGHISLAGQAYDQAITQYEKALDHFGAQSSLGNVILNGLGTAYQQKGDYTKALEQYKRMVATGSPVLKDAALFNLGRLSGQTGQNEERQKAYEQLKTDFPQSMYTNLIKEKGTES